MPWRWLGKHLAGTRTRAGAGHVAPLRQSVWCANALHGQCTGWTIPRDAPVDCLCACHQDRP